MRCMRSSRLLSILILLQLRVRLTAEALAREFEVSVRTIHRDIDALSAAGVPVYGDRGPGGGFQLQAGYQTRLTGLAADETEAMFMIGLPGPAAALGLGAAAARAGNKLLAALPREASAEAGRLSARFHLDPVDWYRASDSVAHLPSMTRAVLDARAVTMTYESWTGVKAWTAEPLGLVLKGSAWYVVANAFASGQLEKKSRTFKVANIIDMTVTSASFTRPTNFDLATHWAAELVRFEASLRPGLALLRATKLGCERLSALGAYAERAVHEARANHTTASAGWTSIQFPIENIEQAALLVLGVGPEVEVTEPAALRERVRALATDVARRMSGHR